MVDDERLKRWVEEKLKEGVDEERIKKSLENTGNDPSIVDRVQDPFENEGREGMEEPVDEDQFSGDAVEEERPSRSEFGDSDLKEQDPDTGGASEDRLEADSSFEPENDTEDFSFDTGTGRDSGAPISGPGSQDSGTGGPDTGQPSGSEGGQPDRDFSSGTGGGKQEEESGGVSMPEVSAPSVSMPSVPLKTAAVVVVALLVVGGGAYGLSTGKLSTSSLSVPAVTVPSLGGGDKSADSGSGGAAGEGDCTVGTRINAVSVRGSTTTAQVTVSRGEAEVVLEVFEGGSLVDSHSKMMSGEGEISVDAKGDRVVFRQTGCTEFKDSVKLG